MREVEEEDIDLGTLCVDDFTHKLPEYLMQTIPKYFVGTKMSPEEEALVDAYADKTLLAFIEDSFTEDAAARNAFEVLQSIERTPANLLKPLQGLIAGIVAGDKSD